MSFMLLSQSTNKVQNNKIKVKYAELNYHLSTSFIRAVVAILNVGVSERETDKQWLISHDSDQVKLTI